MADLKMTDLQSEIWQFLLGRFVGVENAAPRSAILTLDNLTKKKLSDRVFRQVTDFKKAICTTPEVGYVSRIPETCKFPQVVFGI
jgi:hypothetical protein